MHRSEISVHQRSKHRVMCFTVLVQCSCKRHSIHISKCFTFDSASSFNKYQSNFNKICLACTSPWCFGIWMNGSYPLWVRSDGSSSLQILPNRHGWFWSYVKAVAGSVATDLTFLVSNYVAIDAWVAALCVDPCMQWWSWTRVNFSTLPNSRSINCNSGRTYQRIL